MPNPGWRITIRCTGAAGREGSVFNVVRRGPVNGGVIRLVERMPIALSSRTSSLLQSSFSAEQCSVIGELLVAEISENIPWHHDSTPEGLERIRFAIIKLAMENEKNLHTAVDQAKRDWRDLLMMAGFADDVIEHDHWFQRITSVDSGG